MSNLLLLSSSNKLHSEALDVVEVVCDIFKNQWLDLSRLWLLVHIIDEASFALNATVGDLADFLRIERLPRLVIQVLIKRHNENRVNEVDKGVANITPIVKVERQVEKVVFALMMPVDALKEHLLRVFVWNVADHDGCARVLTPQDPVQIHRELWITILTA